MSQRNEELEHLNLRGEKDIEAGNYQSALQKFQQAISIDSNDYKYFSNLALSYYQLQDLNNSKQALLKSIELNPRNYETEFLLGKINFEMNEYDDSTRHLTNALNMNPPPQIKSQIDILIERMSQHVFNNMDQESRSIDEQNDRGMSSMLMSSLSSSSSGGSFGKLQLLQMLLRSKTGGGGSSGFNVASAMSMLGAAGAGSAAASSGSSSSSGFSLGQLGSLLGSNSGGNNGYNQQQQQQQQQQGGFGFSQLASMLGGQQSQQQSGYGSNQQQYSGQQQSGYSSNYNNQQQYGGQQQGSGFMGELMGALNSQQQQGNSSYASNQGYNNQGYGNGNQGYGNQSSSSGISSLLNQFLRQ